MLLKHMLSMQQNAGRIALIHPIQVNQRMDSELDELKRLKQHRPDYLNQYDQLFRLITVWLLVQGFDLTNHQPHQVLKAVCLLNCPDWDIEHMIQQRHQIKKQKNAEISELSWIELQHCLHFFEMTLQAYISVTCDFKSAKY